MLQNGGGGGISLLSFDKMIYLDFDAVVNILSLPASCVDDRSFLLLSPTDNQKTTYIQRRQWAKGPRRPTLGTHETTIHFTVASSVIAGIAVHFSSQGRHFGQSQYVFNKALFALCYVMGKGVGHTRADQIRADDVWLFVLWLVWPSFGKECERRHNEWAPAD